MRRGMAFALALCCCAAPARAQLANQHGEPFQTIQSDGSVIVLSYRGDELYEWYEDGDGFTVIRVKADYFYASLDAAGELVATPHRVGRVDPSTVGLRPYMLPGAAAIQARRTAVADKLADDSTLPRRGVPAGCKLIEGCIVVPEHAAAASDEGGSGQPQHGTYANNAWPGGLVPYTFDAGVSPENQARMREAMDSWEAVAGVQFVPRTTEPNYVNVIHGSGNWSYVGRVGGAQDLSIVNWTYHFIIMHELAHALGVWHEQSRPDRDNYVQINAGNIQSGMENNFDLQSGANMDGPYDFDSIMHYPQCAFANCVCSSSCTTISCLPGYEAWQSQIGQRNHLSVGDADTMVSMYGPPLSADAAEMTFPAEDGDIIEGGSIDFQWSTGQNVTQYRLRVGSTPGGTEFADQTTSATTEVVAGLPTGGDMIYVELASQIAGDWHARSYAYVGLPDQCPGHDDNLDADGDSVPDGCDACPGFDDLEDSDSDQTPDGCDACPTGDDLVDSDGDGSSDCVDGCENDPRKQAPGACGCGNSDVDTDEDGTPDCDDECPDDALKTDAGDCGCNQADADSDGDGMPDCFDLCPETAGQFEPGLCGCGFAPADTNGDGQPDCGNGSNGGTTIQPLTELTFVCGGGGAPLAGIGAIAMGVVTLRRKWRR